MRNVLSSLTRHQLLCCLPFASSASSIRLPIYSEVLRTEHCMWALRCNHAARMASNSCTDGFPRPHTKPLRFSSNSNHTNSSAQYAASKHAAPTTAVTNTTIVQPAQQHDVHQCSPAAAAAATRRRRTPGSCAVVAAAATADERSTGQQQQQHQHMMWQIPGAAQLCVPLVTVDTSFSSSSSSNRVVHSSSSSDSMHQAAVRTRSSSSSSRRRRKQLQGLDQQQQRQAVQQIVSVSAAVHAGTPDAAADVGARHDTQPPLCSVSTAAADVQQQQQGQGLTMLSDCDPPKTQQQQWQQQQLAASIHRDCSTSVTRRAEQQQQQQQATKVLLLGIDPDSNGAVAVIVADLLPQPPAMPCSSSSSSGENLLTTHQSNGSRDIKLKKHIRRRSSSNGSCSQQLECAQQDHQQQQQQQQELYVDLSGAVVSVYDMPVEAIPLRKKTKTSPQRYRRRLDVSRTVATIKKILHQHKQSIMQHTSNSCAAASSSSSSNSSSSNSSSSNSSSVSHPGVLQLTPDYPSSSSSSTSSSHHPSASTELNPNPINPNLLNPTPQPIILRAILEVCSIVPTNGSLSTLNQGFSLGAWTAALLALGVEISTVHVRQWKKDLGLMGCDKDVSRQLAQKIFQQAGNNQDRLLSRKKDHGRAEALLIAAWGCGWSAADHSSSSSKKNKGSTRSGAKSKVPTSSGLSSSSHLVSSSSCCSNGGDGVEDEATFRSPCISSQSVVTSLSPQQGPLREVIRMDGGMHLVGEMNKIVSGSGPNAAKRSSSKPLSHLSDDFDGIFSTGDDDVLLYGATVAEPAAEPRQRGNNISRSSRKRERAAAAAIAVRAEG